jgi:hypothetical protein
VEFSEQRPNVYHEARIANRVGDPAAASADPSRLPCGPCLALDWSSGMTTARWLTRMLLALPPLLAGCGDSLQPILCDGGPCGTQVTWKKTYATATNRKVDILFVIDDTSAIASHAADLAAGFAKLADAANQPVRPTSIHAGFIRAGRCDTSTRASACDVTEQFMRHEWCGTVNNFGGPFTSTFGCLADLGTDDCGPVQPLAAAVTLLRGPPPAGWEGFLRPDAYLLVVVVTASDDASGPPGSPTPVLDIAAGLKALKQDPSQVLVTVVGPGDCGGSVPPYARLTEFVNQFGANGIAVGLCTGGLAASLDRVLNYTIYDSLEPACVQDVRDTDPVQPGLQPSCSVLDYAYDEQTGNGTIAAIPSCDLSAPPCWRLTPNGTCAIFSIDRGPDWCDEAPTNVTIECVVCAEPNDPACAPQTR